MSNEKTTKYLSPSTINIQNHLCMLPCGGLHEQQLRRWTTLDLQPYASYLIKNQPLDRMFKGFVFNGMAVRDHHYIYPLYVGFGFPSSMQDWTGWIDLLFQPNYNLNALYEAATHPPLDIWISIPYPHPFQTNFGKISRINLDFKQQDHRIMAVEWWIQQFLERWAKETELHDKLKLKGFLWQREAIDLHDTAIVKQVNTHIKAQGFLTMWLPNYGSSGVVNCKELGFDVILINTNYYGNTSYDFTWINNTSMFAQAYGTGIQVICGKGLIYNETHLLDYLNLGLPEYNGYMLDSLLLFQFPNQNLRELYEQKITDYIRLYTFIKGSYTRVDYPGIAY